MIIICGGPEDREGRWTAIHCLPSRKRRDLAQLENAGRRVSPVLVGSRVEVFGRRNLASVRGDAVAFIRTGRVTPLNLVGPALGARYPFPPRVHDANQGPDAMHEDDDSYCMTPREIAATVAFWLLLACAALFVLAWYFFASTAGA